MTIASVNDIPPRMRDLHQWVSWRYEHKPGRPKPTKVLKRHNTNTNASSTDPSTWTSFENALMTMEARQYDGIGFVLCDDDPFSAVDLDDCIINGVVKPDAQAIVARFGSYAEVSPSGKGVRIIVRGKFGGTGCNPPGMGIELYCRKRFVSLTGNHLAGTPLEITENQAAVDELYARLKPARPARTSSGPAPDLASFDQDQLAARCWAYLAKCPDAISGDGGHNSTLRAACECYRFGLDDAHAEEVMQRFNAEKTGGEQWEDHELQHKLDDAKSIVEGAGEVGVRLKGGILDRKDPLGIARRFVADCFRHPEHPLIIFCGDEFYKFNNTIWQATETAATRTALYLYLEPFHVAAKRGEGYELLPFKPVKSDIDQISDALKAVVYSAARAPAWIVGADRLPDPSELLVAPNGVFRICNNGLVKVCEPTPRLFTFSALDFELHEDAPKPVRWLEFLNELFGDDEQQIELLQQWFGYAMTTDTRQQKIMLLIGPKRAGKGTIARVLRRVVGEANVCAPTLAGLGTNFGLSPLIDKSNAIISDARLSSRTDQAVVTERLLSISGEDAITIDRKYRELVTMKLSTRFTIITNELPRLSDSSGALASRFLILSLTRSFLGEENPNLTEELLAERAGIAAWAIQGLIKLREDGRFISPAAADALREELDDLASPIGTFVREWCRVGPGGTVLCKDLFYGWQAWCQEQNRRHAGTPQAFGRDLRAVVPGIGQRRSNVAGERERAYEGIRLTPAAEAIMQAWRAKQSDIEDRRRGIQREGTYA